MSESAGERLYKLLPSIYRVRDAAEGEPLRALLGVIEREMDRIESDIDSLYDDWFIETAAEWVVPYIADLLGVRHLHSVESASIFSQRAYVANTLRLRRRKGTVPVLEQLARDVSGWPARAVEFFERLVTQQHANHVRPHNRATVDLRQGNALELLGGPFETAAHVAEVRSPAPGGDQRTRAGRGKYNIPKVGLYLWRLQPYYVVQGTPRPVADPSAGVGDGRYRFSPLGNDVPLFNRPRTETEITHLAEEVNVPGRLRRRALYDDLEALRQGMVDDPVAGAQSLFLSPGNPAFQIFVAHPGGELVEIPAEEILICDLSGVEGAPDWRRPPASKTYTSRTRFDRSVEPPVPVSEALPIQVGVDPALGRLAFPEGVVPERVAVSYAYGFSSDLGGGPYSRAESLAVAASVETWTRTVAQHDPEADHTTLAGAVAEWAMGDELEAIIIVTDSGTYQEALSIPMASGRSLTIQAAGEERPTVRVLDGTAELGELLVTGGDGAEAALVLNGLWIEGGVRIEADSVERLTLEHVTLVPGRGLDAAGEPRRPGLPSLVAELPNADLRVAIRHSITGPLQLPDTITELVVQDSIVHSPLAGGPAEYVPALVSGSLATFPTLSAPSPAVSVQIGDEGPFVATLAVTPTTLAEARVELEAAIRAAHGSVAFTRAEVTSASNRLIVLPGTREPVSVAEADGDPTAVELRLVDGTERQVQALVTPPLDPFPALTAATPALNVAIGDEGPHPISLTPVPETVAQARNRLHNAIRTADSHSAFQNTIVATLEDRLVVLPGAAGTAVLFTATNDDRTTLLELGLYAGRPALAGDALGQRPGPRTTLERVTLFGAVYVREFDVASETIFTGPAVAERRQVGCTRFCFLPAGSRVPRRFRCQPDLALIDYAREIGKETADELPAAERDAVSARVTPAFTSVVYGEPAYAQLTQTCAEEIRTGAEDGAEMGAFEHLKQPQREANLHASLAEYLRLGLQAGIFFVT
ncbi:MAG TPA: hypothetical protein VLC95_07515 [Anaerolineae bacterium]|nr:hypothetical protein [Anaerolineae bacterium]